MSPRKKTNHENQNYLKYILVDNGQKNSFMEGGGSGGRD